MQSIYTSESKKWRIEKGDSHLIKMDFQNDLQYVVLIIQVQWRRRSKGNRTHVTDPTDRFVVIIIKTWNKLRLDKKTKEPINQSLSRIAEWLLLRKRNCRFSKCHPLKSLRFSKFSFHNKKPDTTTTTTGPLLTSDLTYNINLPEKVFEENVRRKKRWTGLPN